MKPVAETDRELIRRVSGREPEAFEEVYRRYSPAAFGLALRVLRQPFLAQEVVHDAFAAVWNAPDAFDPAGARFARSSCRSSTTGRSMRSAGRNVSGTASGGRTPRRSQPKM